LNNQGAYCFREEGGDPVNHVGGDTFGQEGSSKCAGVDVIEACFNVEEECRDPKLGSLEGPDHMGEGQAGVKGAEAGKGTALVWIEEAIGVGQASEPDCHDSFLDF